MTKRRSFPSKAGIACIFFTGLSLANGNCSVAEEQRKAKTRLSSLVQEVRALDSTQLLTLSVVTPKADLGFMLITPDLHAANRIEKQTQLSSLGADVLMPVYSYLSLTEESEYAHDRGRICADAGDGAETSTTARQNSTKAMEAFESGWQNIATTAFIRRCPTGRWFASTI